MTKDPFLRAVIIGVAMAVALIWVLGQAMAQELPPEMHHPDNPNHWYDFECCNHRDCRPWPADDIAETAEGYVVKSLNITIPYNSTKARRSKDGEWHVCTYTMVMSTGKTEGVRCIYTPPRAF